MESAFPPLLVGDVVGTLVDAQYVNEVRFGVQPGLFDNQLVNEVLDLLTAGRARVDEVKGQLEDEDLSNDSDAYTNPNRLDADSGEHSPRKHEHAARQHKNSRGLVSVDVILARHVLVNR